MRCVSQRSTGAICPSTSCAWKSKSWRARMTFAIACVASVFVEMDTLLYVVIRTLVAIAQALPLRWVARLGRMGGTLVYWLDGRHRKMAINNLKLCFARTKSD